MMAKAKYKISNWKQYNQALINRGSITFWIDEAAIQGWHNTKHHGKRGRNFTFANVAIETEGIFKQPLRACKAFWTRFSLLRPAQITAVQLHWQARQNG